MMRSMLIAVALVSAATQMYAQAPARQDNSIVGSTRNEWQQITGFIAKAAEQMPESNYSFKPTPEVRSFGQLIAHIAGAQFLICSAALAEPAQGAEDKYEKANLTKNELIAALRSSTEYCTRAYMQPDAATSGMTKLFGADRTRLAALLRNTVHNGEHYGNIVTYMRIKGMVPPSSQPAPR